MKFPTCKTYHNNDEMEGQGVNESSHSSNFVGEYKAALYREKKRQGEGEREREITQLKS